MIIDDTVTREDVLAFVRQAVDSDPSILEHLSGLKRLVGRYLETAHDTGLGNAVEVCQMVKQKHPEHAAGAQLCIKYLRELRKDMKEEKP